VLQWNNYFKLQSATNAAGPYVDMIGTSSLFTNDPANASPRFYRLRQ